MPAVTYSLTNDAGGRFAIHATSGVVTVASGALLDYEAATSHAITVEASDGEDALTQVFTINLRNVTAVISGTVFVDVNSNGLFATYFTSSNLSGGSVAAASASTSPRQGSARRSSISAPAGPHSMWPTTRT